MMRAARALSLSLLLGAAFPPGAMAQQITGTPGSPSATIPEATHPVVKPKVMGAGGDQGAKTKGMAVN